mgnify:CR=1 FL=1
MFNLQFCISNYCYPWKWPSRQQMRQICEDRRIRIAIGAHPRFASKFQEREHLDRMERYLQEPGVVALGEVGVDYSGSVSNVDRKCQEQVLHHVLPLASRLRLPVIVHCRGGEEATEDCLRILRRHLSSKHPIHCHCFSGTSKEMRKWLSVFSEVVFGITGLLLQRDQRELAKAVREMPLQKIIVETDSPFLRPPVFHGRATSCMGDNC